MKKKRLKIFAASSLAIMMGIGTLCGVLITPMNSAQANTSREDVCDTSSTSSTGLISPKENDPVIYTTESGIEIKYRVDNLLLKESDSNNLFGFAYFNTYAEDKFYTWVIIGKSTSGMPSKGMIDGSVSYQELETLTPAGQAIYEEHAFQRNITVVDNSMLNVSATEEIPSGCVLCLANDVISTGTANTDFSTAYNNYNYGNKYTYSSYYLGTLRTTMDNYYLNDTFGFDKIYDCIEEVSITTYGLKAKGENSFDWYNETISSYVFPLASTAASNSFVWSNYLTAEQMKLSSVQWLRDGNNSGSYVYDRMWYYSLKRCLDSTGTESTLYVNNSSPGYRPAFVLKLL